MIDDKYFRTVSRVTYVIFGSILAATESFIHHQDDHMSYSDSTIGKHLVVFPFTLKGMSFP